MINEAYKQLDKVIKERDHILIWIDQDGQYNISFNKPPFVWAKGKDLDEVLNNLKINTGEKKDE